MKNHTRITKEQLRALDITIGLLLKIALPLVLAVVLILIVTSAKGKAGELNKPLTDTLSAGWPWGCKDINKNGPDAGTPDADVNSVTFDEFMKSMNRVYDNCNTKGNCGSGINNCEQMTLKLPTGVSCYKVKRAVLDSYGMTYFSSLPLCVWGSSDFNLFCNEEPSSDLFGSMVKYYGQTGDSFCKDLHSSWISCASAGEYFSVGDGAKITVSAKQRGIVSVATDIKLQVDGGGDYASCTDAPLIPQCTTDSQCNKNNHGYCQNGVCIYNHYCTYLCGPINGNLCPASGPDAGKCIKIMATCTLGGSCTVWPGYSLTNTCSGGIKTTITGLVSDRGSNEIKYETSPITHVTGESMIWGEERYYQEASSSLPLQPIWDSASNDISMSLDFVKIDSLYNVVLYQGCY